MSAGADGRPGQRFWMHELREYTAAVDTPPLTDDEQAYLDELWQNKFYLEDVEPAFREI